MFKIVITIWENVQLQKVTFSGIKCTNRLKFIYDKESMILLLDFYID